MTEDEALAWAADARATRDDVVDGLASGDLDLGTVLERAGRDPLVGRIHAVTVLESLPGWGKVACRRALAGAGIDETDPIGGLDAALLLELFGTAP
jgi:hypothetical protein